MKQYCLRNLVCMAFFAGICFSANLYAGLFDSNDEISIPENKVPNPNTPAVKFAATLHETKFVDARTGVPPKNIGMTSEKIWGISGNNLLLDREVSVLVTQAFKKRFDDAGFQFVDDGSALYELGGVIKELTYNVKSRDEISISIETTLKEIATGKIIWSGVVVEKDNRFAGVSGNSKSDIANYLRSKLGIITKKTYDAISGILIASRPELFNVLPGSKPISGVTVLFTTGSNQPASSAIPVVSVMSPPKTGVLVLSTKPSRAKVYIEGVYYGMSPLKVEIEAKTHNVSAKLDGYKTATEKVSVRKNDMTELELELEH